MNQSMQMNLIYLHNYLCLWVDEIKHISLMLSPLGDYMQSFC